MIMTTIEYTSLNIQYNITICLYNTEYLLILNYIIIYYYFDIKMNKKD